MRAYLVSERCLIVVWIITTVLLVIACRWPTIVRYHLMMSEFVLIDELLILVPILLPLFLIKAVQYDIEHWARRPSPRNSRRRADRWRFAWEKCRVYVGVAVAPILLVTTCWDLSRVFLPDLANGGWAGIILLLPLIAVFPTYPLLLRIIWPTSKLPDQQLCRGLQRLAGRARLRVRNIMVWRAPFQAPNAAVSGTLPQLTYVFLTDALLKQFNNDEIEATFAHELGHIAHHHNLLRMLALLLPVSVFGCLFQIAASNGSTGIDTLAARLAQPGIGLLITVSYLVVVFGWFCRQLEHQADTFACRLLASQRSDGTRNDPMSDSEQNDILQRYLAVLAKLSAYSETDRREWLHPSMSQRSDFVIQAFGNCQFQKRFERRIGAVSLLVSGLTLSSLGICVWFAATG